MLTRKVTVQTQQSQILMWIPSDHELAGTPADASSLAAVGFLRPAELPIMMTPNGCSFYMAALRFAKTARLGAMSDVAIHSRLCELISLLPSDTPV